MSFCAPRGYWTGVYVVNGDGPCQQLKLTTQPLWMPVFVAKDKQKAGAKSASVERWQGVLVELVVVDEQAVSVVVVVVDFQFNFASELTKAYQT
jgi:hypothetical protein